MARAISRLQKLFLVFLLTASVEIARWIQFSFCCSKIVFMCLGQKNTWNLLIMKAEEASQSKELQYKMSWHSCCYLLKTVIN